MSNTKQEDLIYSANKIVEQDGNCKYIYCEECPGDYNGNCLWIDHTYKLNKAKEWLELNKVKTNKSVPIQIDWSTERNLNYLCPTCEVHVIELDYKYCPICGQAIKFN